MNEASKNAPLHLTPLGAGDLIDRAVRFYRQNFWTFVLIAAPPIIFGMIVTMLWTIAGRQIFPVAGSRLSENLVFSAIFRAVGSFVILFIEAVTTLMVMGGAARNFVRHLLFGEPITVRETYKNVRARLGGLLAASLLIVFLLGFFGIFIFYFGFFLLSIAVIIVFAALYSIPALAIIAAIFLGLAILFGTGWLFFLVASRFAYVPQIMLVEGQGMAAAVGRSVGLAGGNVRRLYALFVFTTLATYAALLLFYIPLGWYAYLSGVDIMSFDPDVLPVWYQIANQVISQASFILLMPVWMIGLCLLYVDERVRHEGYDIELMAARNLGEIPPVPREFQNPLQPALAMNRTIANKSPAQKNKSSMTTLGLD